jgi:hypothetical protein
MKPFGDALYFGKDASTSSPRGVNAAPASPGATSVRRDMRPIEMAVHGFDQIPGALIAHVDARPAAKIDPVSLIPSSSAALVRSDPNTGRYSHAQPCPHDLIIIVFSSPP